MFWEESDLLFFFPYLPIMCFGKNLTCSSSSQSSLILLSGKNVIHYFSSQICYFIALGRTQLFFSLPRFVISHIREEFHVFPFITFLALVVSLVDFAIVFKNYQIFCKNLLFSESVPRASAILLFFKYKWGYYTFRRTPYFALYRSISRSAVQTPDFDLLQAFFQLLPCIP